MDGKRRPKTSIPKARLVIYRTRAIGIRWRFGNKRGEVSAETTDRDEAIGQRAILLENLKKGIFPKREQDGPGITWEQFRFRYWREHASTLSEASRSAWTTSANHLERELNPRFLVEVNKGALSKLRGKLLDYKIQKKDAKGEVVSERSLSPRSVATYIRTIRAALGWAHDMELLAALPRLRTPKGLKRRRGMRSRPITGEEFDRIIDAAATERPNDAADWQDFLRGLSHSTLRVDELRRLSWESGAELSIDAAGKYPMIRMFAEGHKSGNDCYQPMTPEFWALISRPGRSRTGYVFPLRGRGGQMTRKRVIRTISAIGRAAGVVTEISTKKTATSHDIGRRAALTRLAATMTMSQTQQWARHADPRTTSEFYIRHEAEALAEAAGWKSVANVLQPPSQSHAEAKQGVSS